MWKTITKSFDYGGGVPMISTKGKRKVVFEGSTYYWHIKKDENEIPWIHIVSEDKSVYMKRGFDKEISVGSQYIKDILGGRK